MKHTGPPWSVVHCVHSIAIGGQEVVILSLAERANRALFSPRVLCMQGAGELAPRFEALGIPVDVLPRPVGAGSIATLAAMRRYLREKRPAILHTHNSTPHQYGSLARIGAHVPVFVHTKHGRNHQLSDLGRRMEGLASRITDAVVPVSLDAADVAREIEHVPAARIRVIRNGVDISTITPLRREGSGWNVVHVARFDYVKDQATLLRAARLVFDHEPRFRLDIVGDGSPRQELEGLAASLGLRDIVRFHGFQADVRPFLYAADAFVLSSLSEGIALTLLEAMAAELPVVATDVGGNREVVVPGETGYLVPSGDPVALSRALIALLDNPQRARAFGLAGRARVATEFALSDTVAAYESLYLELLHRHGAAAPARTPTDWVTGVRRATIRAYEGGLQRRPVFRYWQELEDSQWWTRNRIEALQFKRLRRLLVQAQATSPWYRAEWQRLGLDAQALTRPEGFHRWPVIDRDTVRRHRAEMRSTAEGVHLIAKATGGSSGVPLQFDIDEDSYVRRMAAWHRGYGWAAAAPGTRQWYLWGVAPFSSSAWVKNKDRLFDRVYRHITVSCFDLSESTVDRILASLVRTKPHAVVAYTNAIYAFARMLEARHLVPPSPGSIVVGAERLHQFQRETIERVFRAPVFETYGSREFTLIAAECERHDGLHVTTENLLVEVLDDEGAPVPAGTEGNVVVTDLTNFGMPFIRYSNGDRAIASASACPCGRGLPLLAQVTGRRLDVLSTPDGRALPGEFFPHILKELATVQRFQVVQTTPETVVIRLVAPAWREDDERWLRREIAAVAGDRLRVDLELVGDIPLTGTGKLRVVVNQVGETVLGGDA